MTEIFYIKEGNTSPAFQLTLTPSPIDLTGATVVFSMRNRATGTVKINRQAATIVGAATAGVVKYPWVAADTDTAGTYEAEFEVTYADTTIEAFPNYGHFIVQIDGKIA